MYSRFNIAFVNQKLWDLAWVSYSTESQLHFYTVESHFNFIRNTHLDYFQYSDFYMTRILFYNSLKEILGDMVVLGKWQVCEWYEVRRKILICKRKSKKKKQEKN